MASRQGSHWLIESPTGWHLSDIFQFYFKLYIYIILLGEVSLVNITKTVLGLFQGLCSVTYLGSRKVGGQNWRSKWEVKVGGQSGRPKGKAKGVGQRGD